MPKGIYVRTSATRAKISATLKGHTVSKSTRAKISAANKGYRHSKEACSRIREASQRHWADPEVRAKMCAALQGHSVSNEGRAKMSAWQKGQARPNQAGANNYFWRGGVAYYSQYCPGWKRIRNALLKQATVCCEVCQSSADLVVHHIDSNKKNCGRENLWIMCRACHARLHTSTGV